jgi:hypothetical protein
MCGHFRGETTPGDLPATCLNRRRNPIPVSAINEFLLKHSLRIASNPCISPDFCLDWPALSADVKTGKVTEYAKSRFATKAGEFTLVENAQGDCAWKLHGAGSPLADGAAHAGATFFPVSWANLLKLKNLIQEHNPASTIFPTAGAQARPQHARRRRALHHAALAGRRVGDERPRGRPHRQPELHPARARL